MLKFSSGNSKLNALAKYLGLKTKQVVTFDLPAGYTCPAANICKTFANRETGKITKVGRVFCYAAKTEAYAPPARRLRWNNFDALNEFSHDIVGMAELIESSIPEHVKIVRIHSSGDFFSREYFKAWHLVASMRPDVQIFGYTKILEYVLNKKPKNFVLNFSYGSSQDSKKEQFERETGYIVPTAYIAEIEGQYPDFELICENKDWSHEDYFAILERKSFVLNIH